MENLKTVSALVKNILEHDQKARNTDNHLYLMVLEHYSGLRGIDIHAMTVPVFLKELDGGQLDNPELSMLEARAEILAGFGLQMRALRVQVYEEVMEKAEAVEAVNASLLDLAKQIDQFSDEYDHYEYADRVDDKKSNIVEIYHDLTNGNAAPYRDFLEQVIEDSDEISVVQAATQLKNELDKAVSRPKESVIDQLKQISGQTVPSKMSHSFKEPER